MWKNGQADRSVLIDRDRDGVTHVNIIRRANVEDTSVITEIYNEAILSTTATFDLEPRTLEDRRAWLKGRDPKHVVLVAEEAGRVVGWASLGPFGEKKGYSITAEVSFYVAERARGRGLGGALFRAILREGEAQGFHSLISRITSENEQSIAMHERAGFVHVGKLREVGQKFGRLLDVCLMQKIIVKG